MNSPYWHGPHVTPLFLLDPGPTLYIAGQKGRKKIYDPLADRGIGICPLSNTTVDIQRSTPKFHAAPSSWTQRHICLKLTSITFCVAPPLLFTISFQMETSEFCWKSIQSFNVWFLFNAFPNFAGIKTTAGTPPSVTSSCIVWVSAPRCKGPRRTLMGQDGQAGGDPILSAKTYY